MAVRFNGNALGPKTAEVERMIETVLGVKAMFVPDYDRLRVKTSERVQSRIDKNNAPKHMVQRYANQMSEFDFPPPVVTEDDHTVDGNTRFAAYAARTDRYVPALVIPVKWENASEGIRRKLLLLSEMLNNMNGLPLDHDEQRTMVENMIEEGQSDEDIRGKVGFSVSEIRELRERYAAKVRIKDLGIVPGELDINANSLRALGGGKAMRLDDATYRDLVELVDEAGLKANEVKAIATTLYESGSADMRSERLARERTARAPQIAARREGQDVRNLAHDLRGKLKWLLANQIMAFVERNPEKVEEHLDLLRKGQDIIREILDLQVGQSPLPGPLGEATEARVQ